MAGDSLEIKELRAKLDEKLGLVSVGEIVDPERKLIYVGYGDSVRECLGKLAEHRILSAPVVDLRGRWLGFVDFISVLSHAYRSHFLEKDSSTPLTFEERASIWQKILDEEMSEIVDNAHGDSLLFSTVDSPSISLLPFFAGGTCHRALVRKVPEEEIHNVPVYQGHTICSQLDVIKAVDRILSTLENSEDVRDLLVKHVLDQELGNLSTFSKHPDRPTLTIKPDTSLLDALELLMDKKSSCLGVVDEQGKLIGNLSASDLKGIRFLDDGFNLLKSKVWDVLNEFSKKSTNPVTVKVSNKFSDIIRMINDKNIHRIWVVDEAGAPITIITLTDVLKFLHKLC